MRQVLSLEGLEVLDAIERGGSFAAAADSLHRVPSAITYAIQKLEQDLGVRLFRKDGRRSVLTPAGRVLLEQGRELLAAASRLAETTRQIQRGWESQLTLAVDSLVDFSVVADALQGFLQLDTGTEIRVSEEVLAGAWEAVLEDRADLVVGVTRSGGIPAELEWRAYMDMEFVFAVAPGHPLARPAKPLQPADIEPFRIVVARDSARRRTPMSRRVLASQPVLTVADIAQKIEAQCRGFGVGYLPRHRIERELAQGRLVLPPMARPDAPEPTVLAWKHGRDGRALRWFVEWFADAHRSKN